MVKCYTCGDSISYTRRKPLYCGSQSQKGTCRYNRWREVIKAYNKKNKKGVAKSVHTYYIKNQEEIKKRNRLYCIKKYHDINPNAKYIRVKNRDKK